MEVTAISLSCCGDEVIQHAQRICLYDRHIYRHSRNGYFHLPSYSLFELYIILSNSKWYSKSEDPCSDMESARKVGHPRLSAIIKTLQLDTNGWAALRCMQLPWCTDRIPGMLRTCSNSLLLIFKAVDINYHVLSQARQCVTDLYLFYLLLTATVKKK